MALHEERLNGLHPAFRRIVKKLIRRAESDGMKLCVVCGLRTYEEQRRLYAQGRTKPGKPCTRAVQGKIVTNARPGYSWHNFGLAVDFCFVAGKNARPTWVGPWKRLGEIGKSLGLIWGGDFKSIKDKPHFEWHPGLTLAQARAGKRPEASKQKAEGSKQKTVKVVLNDKLVWQGKARIVRWHPGQNKLYLYT